MGFAKLFWVLKIYPDKRGFSIPNCEWQLEKYHKKKKLVSQKRSPRKK